MNFSITDKRRFAYETDPKTSPIPRLTAPVSQEISNLEKSESTIKRLRIKPNPLGVNSVCLAMIVRDSAETIEAVLDSVKNMVDAIVIVDTGSKDNTIKVLKNWGMTNNKNLLVYKRLWKNNFAESRNQALELAKKTGCAYIMLMDDRSIYHGPDFKPTGHDYYEIEERYGNLSYAKPFLIRAKLSWQWHGVTHEYLLCTEPSNTPVGLRGCWREHAAHTPAKMKEKLERDLVALLEVDKQTPDDARTVFYLAQTLRDLNLYEKAALTYLRRIALGGWVEEVWYSYYQYAIMIELLGSPKDVVIDAYLKAYNERPIRAEPLYQLARYCRLQKMHHAAVLFAKEACATPVPLDRLFLDVDIYTWRSIEELALNAYYAGGTEVAVTLYQKAIEKAPESERERIKANLKLVENAVEEKKNPCSKPQ